MFREYIKKLIQELSLGGEPLSGEVESFPILMEGVEVMLRSMPPGILYTATIAPLPEEKAEEMMSTLLRGNFCGQATRKAYLGLDESGHNVVATMLIPEVRSYKEFRDMLEDFGNVVAFWKEELTKA